MSAPGAADENPHFAYDSRVVATFVRLTGGFWREPPFWTAWIWTIGLAASLAATVGVNVAVNTWNGWFFNALEARDAEKASLAALVFIGLTVLVAAVGVATLLTRETLQVRWREWVTRRLISMWLDRQHYYHLGLNGTEPANPEYRIADDTRMALEPIVDFAIGLLSAILGALTFIGILWSIGGSYTFAGSNITIPAYIVLAALLHGAIASGLIFAVGRSLMRKVGARNESEARLRFALMRMRENAPSIALNRGEAGELRGLQGIYGNLVTRWLAVVRQNGRLTWIMNGNSALNPVVPLLLATPKYLAGDLSLGDVTQLAAAYVHVQIAISWFVDNYRRVAECYASVRRVVDLTDALGLLATDEVARGTDAISHGNSVDGNMHFKGLAVHDRMDRVLVKPVEAVIPQGAWVLIAGESGSGKSILVRAIAGLWPWGQGAIAMPQGASVAFLPQRTYLPQGTLRQALLYPRGDGEDGYSAPADTELVEVLNRCGLSALVTRLRDDELWDRILSDGERQRLAIARVLVSRPDVIILDDATGGVEATAEIELLALIKSGLPDATVVTVARHAGMEAMHDCVWTLCRTSGGARLETTPVPQRRKKSVRTRRKVAVSTSQS
jgi:vitamin B12/bleomycin/antimicrobial peptide transport system ATP-binding/permease protein